MAVRKENTGREKLILQYDGADKVAFISRVDDQRFRSTFVDGQIAVSGQIPDTETFNYHGLILNPKDKVS